MYSISICFSVRLLPSSSKYQSIYIFLNQWLRVLDQWSYTLELWFLLLLSFPTSLDHFVYLHSTILDSSMVIIAMVLIVTCFQTTFRPHLLDYAITKYNSSSNVCVPLTTYNCLRTAWEFKTLPTLESRWK